MRTTLRVATLAWLLLPATGARAALGGTAATVESDRRALSATRPAAASQAGYRVVEFETDGARVRQYLSPEGLVFGVAWNGLSHPDLDTLLGAYAPAWRQAEARAAPVRGRRFRAVASPNLVVERWGHPRNLRGRAWDPALLPPGVTADAIR